VSEHAVGERVVATIGAFDGVHRGHVELLRQVVARATALACGSTAVTFDPHPDLVLYPDRHLTELSDLEEKRRLMMGLGIDLVLVFEFTREFSMLRPEDFIGRLQAQQPICELWVGSDFALGRGRSGTIAALAEIGSVEGFALHVVPPVKTAREVISSTYIRALLAQGEVRHASELLGRSYTVSGVVTSGAGRGRSLDFPTANLQVPATRTVPADGVYAALVQVDGRPRAAVVNVGGRPTFSESERLVEVHLLDFEGDLYDQSMSVQFVERLRDTHRFNSVEELREQIGRDIVAARGLPELVAVACRVQCGATGP
jgi:riboflavin kinase/FMN adenylyltransferase